MKIYFDLDGVLVDSVTEVEKAASKMLGEPFKFTQYNPQAMHNISRIDAARILDLFTPVRCGTAPLMSRAQWIVKKLQKNHEVGILTARVPNEKGMFYTYSQCLTNFGIEPVMLGSDNKVKWLNQNNVDVYVEDCWENARDIFIETDTFCLLLNTSYNTNEFQLYPYTMRVNNLYEAYQQILALERMRANV